MNCLDLGRSVFSPIDSCSFELWMPNWSIKLQISFIFSVERFTWFESIESLRESSLNISIVSRLWLADDSAEYMSRRVRRPRSQIYRIFRKYWRKFAIDLYTRQQWAKILSFWSVWWNIPLCTVYYWLESVGSPVCEKGSCYLIRQLICRNEWFQ